MKLKDVGGQTTSPLRVYLMPSYTDSILTENIFLRLRKQCVATSPEIIGLIMVNSTLEHRVLSSKHKSGHLTLACVY
jgi:hypothetical protein